MKKFVTAGVLTVVLVACSSAIGYSDNHTVNKNTLLNLPQDMFNNSFMNTLVERKNHQTMLEELAAQERAKRLKEQKIKQHQFENKRAIEKRIKEIRKYADKTWYVFSGSTPSGWDCSGLVVWFYEGLGKTLPHSATKQGWIKPKTEFPMPGDIVVFRQKGYKNFHHSAIYLGDNKIIHSGFKKGDKTEIISLDYPSLVDADVKFIRILDVPLD